MAVKRAGLSATKVKTVQAAGMYCDGDGLYLQVSSGGTKSWVYRYSLSKRRRDMGLGSLDVLSLAEARLARNDQKKLLNQGVDPIEHRNADRAARLADLIRSEHESITFKKCAEEFIAAKQAEWKSAKHKQQWNNTLRDYAYPIIGQLSIAKIDQAAVLKCLKPIWTIKTETATRVRQRIEAILDYAKACRYREGDNPAVWKGGLEPILPNPTKLKNIKHHDSLHYDKLPNFMSELRSEVGIGARALRLAILTATRTSEVINARWNEVDLDKKVWTVPKERMKAGKVHRVALSSAAVRLFEELPRINKFVFPGMSDEKPLSNMAMAATLRRMGRTDITVHGFRSTFRDWVAEKTNFPARVAETALAHQLTDKAEKAYQRGDLIEKRFEMMEAWASYCDSHKAKVVRLPA
ncbi:integrase arm-type DNA-binding domain-containing protein [Pseudomonadales bacterium]|nr:integrase arm-type DNA-binding domain-containing protein [Pseudomonadales bacterium]